MVGRRVIMFLGIILLVFWDVIGSFFGFFIKMVVFLLGMVSIGFVGYVGFWEYSEGK